MSYFPVRCFTCGKPRSQLWKKYSEKVDDIPEDLDSKEKFEKITSILDVLKVKNICCRRMFMTHVDIEHIQCMYPTYPGNVQRLGNDTKSEKLENYTLTKN